MRQWKIAALFIFGLFPYVCASVHAQTTQLDVQKNPIDLRTEKFFARPITQLEMILLNLKTQAQEVASFFKDDKKLYVVDRLGRPDGRVGFDPTSGRIMLLLDLTVDDMSDPWRETCNATLQRFYGWFYFPPGDYDKLDEDVRLRVLEKYFGEAARLDRNNAKQAIDIFLNSLVTRVTFSVVNESKKGLKWFRTCSKDNMTGKVSYTEHRYPER